LAVPFANAPQKAQDFMKLKEQCQRCGVLSAVI